MPYARVFGGTHAAAAQQQGQRKNKWTEQNESIPIKKQKGKDKS